jgi:hypothetical protein
VEKKGRVALSDIGWFFELGRAAFLAHQSSGLCWFFIRRIFRKDEKINWRIHEPSGLSRISG